MADFFKRLWISHQNNMLGILNMEFHCNTPTGPCWVALLPPVLAVEVIELEPCFCLCVCVSVCVHSHSPPKSKKNSKVEYIFWSRVYLLVLTIF